MNARGCMVFQRSQVYVFLFFPKLDLSINWGCPTKID